MSLWLQLRSEPFLQRSEEEVLGVRGGDDCGVGVDGGAVGGVKDHVGGEGDAEVEEGGDAAAAAAEQDHGDVKDLILINSILTVLHFIEGCLANVN